MTIRSRFCWATATARSNPPSITRSDTHLKRSCRGISPATVGSTSPSPIQATTRISVLLGNGDGTFQPAVQYAAGATPIAIVAGDFTGSDRLGLATANTNSNNISILLSNGDGTFVDPSQLAITPYANPLVADVNGDGTDDVLVVDGHGNILYRQGIPGQPGSFEPPVPVQKLDPSTGAVEFPSRDIAWVPNTMDGPLLASVDAQDNAISLFAFRDGSFVRVGSLTTGQLPAQIAAADLNGSGWDDLVVRNAGDGTL